MHFLFHLPSVCIVVCEDTDHGLKDTDHGIETKMVVIIGEHFFIVSLFNLPPRSVSSQTENVPPRSVSPRTEKAN
jgi:hypothetical protein